MINHFNDLAELPLDIEDYPEDTTLSLWVVLRDRTEMVFHDATSAVRYKGWWTISHDWLGNRKVSSMVEDEKVMYFRIVESSNLLNSKKFENE